MLYRLTETERAFLLDAISLALEFYEDQDNLTVREEVVEQLHIGRGILRYTPPMILEEELDAIVEELDEGNSSNT